VIINYNMKKTIFILFFIAGLGVMAKAQQLTEPTLEIGYGGWTPPILSGQAKVRSEFFANYIIGSKIQVISTGSFHAALTAKIWKLTFGVEGSYEIIPITNNFSTYNGSTEEVGTVKVTNSYWTAMARVQWPYVTVFQNLRLYGGVAFGYYQVNSKLTENNSYLTPDHSSSDNGFAYQYTPIGGELGKKKVKLFFELGYGYLGLVSGGIRIKL